MTKAELKLILENHKKWLDGEDDGVKADLRRADLRDADLRRADLRYADLRYADLRYADLSYADLKGADLRRADLIGADLDFSQLNLSCDGLNFKIDERIAKQLVYHVVNLMQYSDLDVIEVFKDNVYKWLETSHIVKEYHMAVLEEKEIKK